ATTRLDPTTPAVRRLETVGGTAFTRGLQLQKELAVGPAGGAPGGGDPGGRETVGGTASTRGRQLQKELAVGAAVVTAGGGDLPAEFVIHAVIRSDTEPVTRDGVARAWRSTLQQAPEWEFSRVTAPPLGTGAGNLSMEDAADIMVPILKAHLDSASFPGSVSIVVETPADRDTFEAALRRCDG